MWVPSVGSMFVWLWACVVIIFRVSRSPPTTKINTMFTNMEGDGKGFYSPTKHSISMYEYHIWLPSLAIIERCCCQRSTLAIVNKGSRVCCNFDVYSSAEYDQQICRFFLQAHRGAWMRVNQVWDFEKNFDAYSHLATFKIFSLSIPTLIKKYFRGVK